MPRLRAIDLYSGVGGWSLGLSLAGIDVVASYERWGPANETSFKNNKHQAHTVDIRRLSLSDLPEDIDIVVGSPPCTQFSFANRGGSGDIRDGLEDVITFLTIVDFLKPRIWAMENVPRMAKILQKELGQRGRLARFRHLEITPHIVNMEEYGVPQRRKRCIAGNFDFGLLRSYAGTTAKLTLGDVVGALAADPILDPTYALRIPRRDLHDHVPERALSPEEVRINRSAKELHPVYNSMPFPDSLDRSVRTITATCTRVSRESIVIEDSTAPLTYRRLTVRERACLQGFPITFQFYGSTYAQKLTMVGNAIPPAFTYYLAHAFKGTPKSKLPAISTAATKLTAPLPPPPVTRPDTPGGRYPANRRFRFAIPSLRLKSGVRFELANGFDDGYVSWRVSFYFGTSKSIQSLTLGQGLLGVLWSIIPKKIATQLRAKLAELSDELRRNDLARMQQVWSHRGPGGITPFMLLDRLSLAGTEIAELFAPAEPFVAEAIAAAVRAEYERHTPRVLGVDKLCRNGPLILAGLLTGSVTNAEFDRCTSPLTLPKPRSSVRTPR